MSSYLSFPSQVLFEMLGAGDKYVLAKLNEYFPASGYSHSLAVSAFLENTLKISRITVTHELYSLSGYTCIVWQ